MSNYACRFRSFLFKQSWNSIFLELTDEDAGALIKAVLNYTEGIYLPPEKAILRTVCSLLLEQMEIESRIFYKRLVKNGTTKPPILDKYMPLFIEERKANLKMITSQPVNEMLTDSEKKTKPYKDPTENPEEINPINIDLKLKKTSDSDLVSDPENAIPSDG